LANEGKVFGLENSRKSSQKNYCRRCATKLKRVKISLDFRTPAPKKIHQYMYCR
jgi:hypothetical protein